MLYGFFYLVIIVFNLVNYKMKEKKRTKKDQHCFFLERLKKILNNSKNRKIIHWNKDGTTIVISNISDLSKKILPKYFNHRNYSSFVRQLNIYKFRKIKPTRITDDELFINENFKKNNGEIKETKEIKLKAINNNKENIKTKIKENDIKKSISNYFESQIKVNNENSKVELNNSYSDINLNMKILNILLEKTKENILLENENMINLKQLRKNHEYFLSDLKKLDNQIEIFNKNFSFGISKENNQNLNLNYDKDNVNFENSFQEIFDENQDYKLPGILTNESFISNNNYDANNQIEESFCEQLDILEKNYRKYNKKKSNLNSSVQNIKNNNIFLRDFYDNHNSYPFHNNLNVLNISNMSSMTMPNIRNKSNTLNLYNMSLS